MFLKFNIYLPGFGKDFFNIIDAQDSITNNNPDAIGEINFANNNVNLIIQNLDKNIIKNDLNNINYTIKVVLFRQYY